MLTHEMAHRPHHIGVKKSWLTWHSQNLETFRQRQPVVVCHVLKPGSLFDQLYLSIDKRNLIYIGNSKMVKEKIIADWRIRLEISEVPNSELEDVSDSTR